MPLEGWRANRVLRYRPELHPRREADDGAAETTGSDDAGKACLWNRPSYGNWRIRLSVLRNLIRSQRAALQLRMRALAEAQRQAMASRRRGN
jgi:hypothetical protein